MSKILVSLLLILCFSAVMHAGMVVTKSDSRLVKLQEALPPGWIMDIRDDSLIIENEEPIWVLRSNFINAPLHELERDDANKEKIIKQGVQTKARFVFILREKRLLPETEQAKAHYFSKYYALFEVSAVGFDTPYARHYPYSTEEQASSIYNLLLQKYLETGIGPVYPQVDYSRP